MADSQADAAQWSVPVSAMTPDDPLLGCLMVITRWAGRPMSAEALTAGLPLVEQRLTPELFVRAAARAGLCSRVVKRELGAIPDAVLPAVLLLRDRGACVWQRRDGEGRACTIQPESGGGEALLPLEQLGALYLGYAIFVRPLHRFDARLSESSVPRAAHWFWGVVTRSWPIYSEVLLASLMINLFALAMPLFTMNVYDRVVPNRIMETLWALAIGVFIVIAFDLLMRGLRGYFIDLAGRRMDVMLSATIFEKVLGIRMEARPPSVGVMASHLQEFEAFREFLTSATLATLVDLPFVLLFIAMMFWIGGPLGWVAVIGVPLVLGLSLALQRPLARVVQDAQRLSAQRQATLVESLVGLETIKAVGAASSLQRKWEQLVGQIAALGLRARLLSSAAINFSNFGQQLAALAVVVLGVYLISADRLTTGGLIACTILVGRALAPLAQVAQLMTRFHQCRIALAALDQLMNLPVERPPDQNFLDRPRLSGAVEFRKVSFRYPGSQVESLAEVSFRIASGERVGFLGRVGSGKTTVTKLILALYQPQSGSVLVDGTELRQLDPAALRRDIGYVAQDVLLFYGSLRDNIAYGAPHADAAAVLRAAEISGVAEFVDRSQQGYDLMIGERGEGLSGGQRQAVAIARAELLAPPLLLLDEPTSAMDSRSEEQYKARLEAHLAGRTLLLVTHRPSMLSLVTRLIVLDQGRVVADGPRDQVIATLAAGKLHAPAR